MRQRIPKRPNGQRELEFNPPRRRPVGIAALARELIEDELAERNFLPRITGIEAITNEIELFHWKVITAAGPRSFLTRRSDHPRKLANGDVLIKDVSNDLYLIPNPKGLDAKSLKLLWVYLD